MVEYGISIPRKVPRKARTCHECGLEDVNACGDIPRAHRSSRPDKVPCSFCLRNTEHVGWYDMWHEQWTTDAKGQPILQDAATDKRAARLLSVMGSVQKKEKLAAEENTTVLIAENAEQVKLTDEPLQVGP